jgi:hypothetical protein
MEEHSPSSWFEISMVINNYKCENILEVWARLLRPAEAAKPAATVNTNARISKSYALDILDLLVVCFDFSTWIFLLKINFVLFFFKKWKPMTFYRKISSTAFNWTLPIPTNRLFRFSANLTWEAGSLDGWAVRPGANPTTFKFTATTPAL